MPNPVKPTEISTADTPDTIAQSPVSEWEKHRFSTRRGKGTRPDTEGVHSEKPESEQRYN